MTFVADQSKVAAIKEQLEQSGYQVIKIVPVTFGKSGTGNLSSGNPHKYVSESLGHFIFPVTVKRPPSQSQFARDGVRDAERSSPRAAAMHMSSESLLIVLVVGLAAGWLAGTCVGGTGFGLLGDVIIGIIGGFIGDWLMPRMGVYLGDGLVAAIANATIGAIVLLLILRLVRGGGRWTSGRWTNGWAGWNRRWR